MKTTIVTAATVLCLMFGACSSGTVKTVKADPTDPRYEPLIKKSSPGYDNVDGSQMQEVREDVRGGRDINIKSDQ